MISKPSVLLFIDWFTPGYKAGGPTRSMVNLIDRLKNDVDFWVVTRNTDYRDSIPYPGIQPDIWLLHDGYHIIYLSSPSMRSIRRSIHSFFLSTITSAKADESPLILYLNGIWSFYFSILPLFCIRRKHFRKIIISPRGMLSSQTWISSSLKKKPFLWFARFIGIYNAVIFHATNEQEKIDIQKNISKKTSVEILPNLSSTVIPSLPQKQKHAGEARFISIARIAPEKNTRFMLEILQEGITGNLSLELYGPIYNEAYWNECRQLMTQLPSNIRVTYHGSLSPDEMSTSTSNCHFLFMPSLGENYGHSIAESLQHGLPVLISDKTPWRNLQEKNTGWDLPLSNPDAFRAAINRCIAMENEEYSLMQKKCLNFAYEISMDKVLIHKYEEFLRP
jgi:glycosyltransferase involved in cell wall biosynthesis